MRPLRSEVSEQSLILMGVPKKYTSKTLKDFRDYGNADLKEVRDFCEDYVENIEVNIEEGRRVFFPALSLKKCTDTDIHAGELLSLNTLVLTLKVGVLQKMKKM